jgi:hypothetical protein
MNSGVHLERVEKPVRIGAPTIRNIARAIVEATGFTAFWALAAAVVKPDWYPVFPATTVVIGLAAWLIVSFFFQSVAVSRGSLHSQSWLQILARRRGQTWLVPPGQPLVRMPDGRWQTDGAILPLDVPHWERRRLEATLTDAGFLVEDRRVDWTRDHRRRIWIYRFSWAAFLGGTWVDMALGPSLWQLPCLAFMLAGAVGVVGLRPPRTTRPNPVWPQAPGAGSRRR